MYPQYRKAGTWHKAASAIARTAIHRCTTGLKFKVTVTGQKHSQLVAARSVSREVYESYLKGQFAPRKSNTRSELEESIHYFDDAIKKDPTFALAYVGLAEGLQRGFF
jgi:hypothetical protein